LLLQILRAAGPSYAVRNVPEDIGLDGLKSIILENAAKWKNGETESSGNGQDALRRIAKLMGNKGVKAGWEVCLKMLRFLPEERVDVVEAMNLSYFDTYRRVKHRRATPTLLDFKDAQMLRQSTRGGSTDELRFRIATEIARANPKITASDANKWRNRDAVEELLDVVMS